MEKLSQSQKAVLLLAGLMFLMSQCFGVPDTENENKMDEDPAEGYYKRANENNEKDQPPYAGKIGRRANEISNIASESYGLKIVIRDNTNLANDEFVARRSTGRQKRTSAISDTSGFNKWANNVVPYIRDVKTISASELAKVQRAMAEISHYSCITFRKANLTTDKNYIYLLKEFGKCTSPIGQQGGKQKLNLNGQKCFKHGTLVHELCHAIGLFHEHTRPDKRKYIRVIWKNIRSGHAYLFHPKPSTEVDFFGLPYDYKSIMHYKKTASVAKGASHTIETRKNTTFANLLGNRVGLSYLDVKTINLLYKCVVPKSCNIRDRDCAKKGFVGKDCKCWCELPTNDYPIEYCDDADKKKYGSLDFKR